MNKDNENDTYDDERVMQRRETRAVLRVYVFKVGFDFGY